jgi:hypothetical protein
MPDEWHGDTGLTWCAWSGRDHDGVRGQGADVVHRNHIIAPDFDIDAEFPKVLDEVEGERVVIIQNENHAEC